MSKIIRILTCHPLPASIRDKTFVASQSDGNYLRSNFLCGEIKISGNRRSEKKSLSSSLTISIKLQREVNKQSIPFTYRFRNTVGNGPTAAEVLGYFIIG